MQVLDRETMARRAPSIFAASPYEKMSRRYRFVPTLNVVALLENEGFHPVRVEQSRSRIEGKEAFTRHMIRFRHARDLELAARVGQEIPELVLVNAHDGTAGYNFSAGIFRVICGNGLVVKSSDLGSISVRHTGGQDFTDRIIEATYQVVSEMPRTLEKIETWKQLQLSPPQREAFAAAAAELKELPQMVGPANLLTPRRSDDRRSDLWTTANVIQEHLLKGGDRGYTDSGRRTTTRPVKSVGEDLRLNRALWTLTEKLAKAVR